MLSYGATIFLSAFLLFQVQFILARYLLPWFGGVPAVWTACMLFFQLTLLAGYAYAHWSARRLGLAGQRRLHLALLLASLAWLAAQTLLWGAPLLPAEDWKPPDESQPLARILALLAASAGPSFFVLSATNPLLQAWFSHTPRQRSSPYRLYALSNLGSLLGLVSYPFAVEVWLPLKAQALAWGAGYAAFAAGIALVAARLRTRHGTPAAAFDDRARPSPPVAHYLLWFALAACASVLFLAITNQMTQEIAVVPFLWMLPLTVYLLSFILCFGRETWYTRPLYGALLLPALALATLLVERGPGANLFVQIAMYAAALFVACMVCHGELARLKPAARHLTAFYLTVTAGGAAGGVFVGVLAPSLFLGYWELGSGLWACAALFLVVLWHDRGSFLYRGSPRPAYAALFTAALLALIVFAPWLSPDISSGRLAPAGPWPYGLLAAAAIMPLLLYQGWAWSAGVWRRGGGGVALGGTARDAACPAEGHCRSGRAQALAAALGLFAAVHIAIGMEGVANTVDAARNFYGVLSVMPLPAQDPADEAYLLKHGWIVHGMQYRAAERRREPAAYYAPDSGIARALQQHPRRAHGLRVGVIGLGAGTLAAYGRQRDYFRFYEINPDVIRFATEHFTYLRDTHATVDIVPGDGRVSLEHELRRRRAWRFDVLALDAFNGDAIPIHLLTREAFAVYLRHLDPHDGILAVHITNEFLDLQPVVRRLARHFGLAVGRVEARVGSQWYSVWMLLSRSPQMLRAVGVADAAVPLAAEQAPLWTDDHSHLLSAIRRPVVSSGAGLSEGACLLLDCPEPADLPEAGRVAP